MDPLTSTIKYPPVLRGSISKPRLFAVGGEGSELSALCNSTLFQPNNLPLRYYLPLNINGKTFENQYGPVDVRRAFINLEDKDQTRLFEELLLGRPGAGMLAMYRESQKLAEPGKAVSYFSVWRDLDQLVTPNISPEDQDAARALRGVLKNRLNSTARNRIASILTHRLQWLKSALGEETVVPGPWISSVQRSVLRLPQLSMPTEDAPVYSTGKVANALVDTLTAEREASPNLRVVADLFVGVPSEAVERWATGQIASAGALDEEPAAMAEYFPQLRPLLDPTGWDKPCALGYTVAAGLKRLPVVEIKDLIQHLEEKITWITRVPAVSEDLPATPLSITELAEAGPPLNLITPTRNFVFLGELLKAKKQEARFGLDFTPFTIHPTQQEAYNRLTAVRQKNFQELVRWMVVNNKFPTQSEMVKGGLAEHSSSARGILDALEDGGVFALPAKKAAPLLPLALMDFYRQQMPPINPPFVFNFSSLARGIGDGRIRFIANLYQIFETIVEMVDSSTTPTLRTLGPRLTFIRAPGLDLQATHDRIEELEKLGLVRQDENQIVVPYGVYVAFKAHLGVEPYVNLYKKQQQEQGGSL